MVEVYIVLGCEGAGRREVLANLELFLAEEETPARVLFSEREAALGEVSWKLRDGELTVDEQLHGSGGALFLVADGRSDPRPFLESLKGYLEGSGHKLGRILTVLPCAFVEANGESLPWFECCIHFSDAVLLTKREGVESRWVDAFVAQFERACYPCLFELVRKGRVQNPARLLYPEARRLSHYFDELEGEELGLEVVLEDEEGDELEWEDEDDEGTDEEPYFVRDAAGGWRVKLPDIGALLDGAEG